MKPVVLILLLCAVLPAWLSCGRGRPHPEQHPTWAAYRDFYRSQADSLSARPLQVRAEALLRMQTETDSLVWHCYAALVMKTYFFTFDVDSMRRYYRDGRRYVARQMPTPWMSELASEYDNLMGNLYARLGLMDSAVFCFERAYSERMRGVHTEAAPDILMNLADACIRQGRYDRGAYWYRRALLICDSLGLDEQKTPVYYGLGQVYMALRDFELSDLYYDLAGQRFGQMRLYEQYIYLNNRGNSYYYRGDYPKALACFRRCDTLTAHHPHLVFERNLCLLNMGDVFLKMGMPDSSEAYLKRSRRFFEEIRSIQALYYVDTQELGLALMRNDLGKARQILSQSAAPSLIEPDIRFIRNTYLQQYLAESGDYKRAYRLLLDDRRMADSVRGEQVRMRVADATMRYQQDSTRMAQNMLIQQQRNEMLQLRQRQFFWIVVAVIALLVVAFVYLYSRKKRDLLLSQNRRTVSSLRLENIRNRLSPHFIFNVLNQEMTRLDTAQRDKMASLVKMMRRNLELAEQMCVTLAEELDFVRTYLELEQSALGLDFRLYIRVDEAIDPAQVWLPSMLIQIPVENAVKHALCDKEGERCLWITVAPEVQGTSIRITDNGGGYRPGSRRRGTGTGMKVIMQTIQILNARNRESIDASVHNVSPRPGETGCEVSFRLPRRYNYTL